LVIGFDQIDPKPLLLGPCKHLLRHQGLVDRRRQRALAHPASAWPAELPDHDLLAREPRRDLTRDRDHVVRGVARRDWVVLPIRQEMDGHKIDR
jgi:hypothetical protein